MLPINRLLRRPTESRGPAQEPVLDPAHIERLMAMPVPERPKIIVVGDDAVAGINPAPPEASAAARRT
jgi:hypothetical protein